MGNRLPEKRREEGGMTYDQLCLDYSRGVLTFEELLKAIKEIE